MRYLHVATVLAAFLHDDDLTGILFIFLDHGNEDAPTLDQDKVAAWKFTAMFEPHPGHPIRRQKTVACLGRMLLDQICATGDSNCAGGSAV
jgi:hypothetical protein